MWSSASCRRKDFMSFALTHGIVPNQKAGFPLKGVPPESQSAHSPSLVLRHSLMPRLLPQAGWGASGLAQRALPGQATEGTPRTKGSASFWSFQSLRSFPWSLLGAGRQTGAGHALAQAAFFHEVLLQAANQLVQQVVGLVNQAEGDVGEHAGRSRLHEGAI